MSDSTDTSPPDVPSPAVPTAAQPVLPMQDGARFGRAWLTARWVPLAVFAALALLPFGAELAGEGFYITLFTRIMILAIAAVSLDLILGYGAMVSFGHAAYLGIGAYTVGILDYHYISNAWISWPLGIALSAFAALLIGAVSLKTRGIFFIMITLAFAQMLYFAATSLSQYGGDDGLTIWGRNSVPGLDAWLDLEDRTTYYFVVFVCLVLVYLVCRALVASRFGRVIRGVKENEQRMRAVGYNPYTYRLVAFTLSGALAGLAGVLLANHSEFVSPAYMAWTRSGELIVMVVLGGMGSLHGAIIGAISFLMLEEILSGLWQHWKVIFGPLLILLVLFARGGIVSWLERRPHG